MLDVAKANIDHLYSNKKIDESPLNIIEMERSLEKDEYDHLKCRDTTSPYYEKLKNYIKETLKKVVNDCTQEDADKFIKLIDQDNSEVYKLLTKGSYSHKPIFNKVNVDLLVEKLKNAKAI